LRTEEDCIFVVGYQLGLLVSCNHSRVVQSGAKAKERVDKMWWDGTPYWTGDLLAVPDLGSAMGNRRSDPISSVSGPPK